MPAHCRNATRKHNKDHELKHEQYLQDTLDSIKTGTLPSYCAAERATGVSTQDMHAVCVLI